MALLIFGAILAEACGASDNDDALVPRGSIGSSSVSTGTGGASAGQGLTKIAVPDSNTIPGSDGGAGFGGASASASGSGGNKGGGGAGGGPEDPPDEPSEECIAMAGQVFRYGLPGGDANATASPVYVRDVLKDKDAEAPNPTLIRPSEFLNYYTLDYGLNASAEMAVTAWIDGPLEQKDTYRLFVGVQAPPPPAERSPMAITIVMDTSISMTGPAMVRARAVGRAIAESLAPGDVVNLVTWNPSTPPLLEKHEVIGASDPEVVGAIDAIYADGGSDLQAGLVRGYDLATAARKSDGSNRLVFISDGRVTMSEELTTLIAKKAAEDIYLVGVGTGPAVGYTDVTMARASNLGGGAFVYIDSELEAHRMFVDRWNQVMGRAASDLAVEVTLPGYFDIPNFTTADEQGSATPVPSLGWSEPLAPGDSVTLVYEMTACHAKVIDLSNPIKLRVRWTVPGEAAPRTFEQPPLTVNDLLAKPSPTFKKAAAVLAYAEAMEKSTQEALLSAEKTVDAALNLNAGDPELDEIKVLIKRHPKY